MEIIKEGKKELFYVNCSNCGCKFTAETNDFQVEKKYKGDFIYQSKYIFCPFCGKKITNMIEKKQ